MSEDKISFRVEHDHSVLVVGGRDVAILRPGVASLMKVCIDNERAEAVRQERRYQPPVQPLPSEYERLKDQIAVKDRALASMTERISKLDGALINERLARQDERQRADTWKAETLEKDGLIADLNHKAATTLDQALARQEHKIADLRRDREVEYNRAQYWKRRYESLAMRTPLKPRDDPEFIKTQALYWLDEAVTKHTDPEIAIKQVRLWLDKLQESIQ